MTNDDTIPEPADPLSYEPRIVAFLDILGFRSFVSEGYEVATRKIKAIDDALDHTLQCIRMQGDVGWVSIRSFSDCFSLSTREEYLPTLLEAVGFLQWNLACGGIFVRGGLSTGHHCETARMIFSQGLVNAYELQKHDRYPRVLVAPNLVPKILRMSYSTDWGWSGPLGEYLLVDGAGACFVDYLQAPVVMGELMGDADDLFEAHAQAIREQLTMHAAEEGVRRKHLWLAKYHDFRVREVFDDEADWDPEYWRDLMKRVVIAPAVGDSADLDVKSISFVRSWPETTM